MPLIIIYPLLYWIVTYWMAGMRAGPEFITSLLILWLNAIAAQVRIRKLFKKFLRVFSFVVYGSLRWFVC